MNAVVKFEHYRAVDNTLVECESKINRNSSEVFARILWEFFNKEITLEHINRKVFHYKHYAYGSIEGLIPSKEELDKLEEFTKEYIKCIRTYQPTDKIELIRLINNKTPINEIDTRFITDFSSVFANSNIEEIPLDELDTTIATDMSYMFANCKNLKSSKPIIISSPLLENINYMFYNCEKLNSNIYINSKAYSLQASSLLENASSFDSSVCIIANRINLSYAFSNCKALSYLPVDNYRNVVNTSYMYENCTNLTLVLENIELLSCKNAYMMFKDSGVRSAYVLLNFNKIAGVDEE